MNRSARAGEVVPPEPPERRRGSRTAGRENRVPPGPTAPAPLPPGHARKGRSRWSVLAVLCISLLVVSLDTTILNVAVPDIVRSLHASSSDLEWAIDAYAIVFAGLLLVLGNLGDRVGRKWILIAGIVVFGLGSAASAFSGSPDRLIAARAFMGIGAAAVMPATLSVLTNVYVRPEERSRAIGIWSGTTGLGVAVGPVLGGWLLAHFWWGSVFLVNVPICAAGLLLVLAVVPNSRDERTMRPDVMGAVLSTGGMSVLLWGIIEAPNRTWTSPLVLGALLAGCGVLALFVVWERHCDHPMLELAFFRSRRFSAAIAGMAMVIFALMGALFLFTQYLQFSLAYSAFATGLRIAPIAAILMVTAPLSMALDRRFGTKPVVGAGMGLVAASFVVLSFTTVRGGYGNALPAFMMMGAGTGLAFAPCTAAVMGSVSLERSGVGSATNSAALQVGGAAGVAVLGSLLNSRYQGQLAPLLAHHVIPHGIVELIMGSLGGALAVAGQVGGALGTALASSARHAFVSGMDLSLLAASVVVGVATVVVLCLLPNRPAGWRRRKASGDQMGSGSMSMAPHGHSAAHNPQPLQ